MEAPDRALPRVTLIMPQRDLSCSLLLFLCFQREAASDYVHRVGPEPGFPTASPCCCPPTARIPCASVVLHLHTTECCLLVWNSGAFIPRFGNGLEWERSPSSALLHLAEPCLRLVSILSDASSHVVVTRPQSPHLSLAAQLEVWGSTSKIP